MPPSATSLDVVWPVVERRMQERAAAAAELVEEMLRQLGPLRRSEGQLFAGERCLNEEHHILPRVSRAASVGICLYLGNRRIATASTVEAGEVGPIGGFPDAVLVDTVLRRAEHYRGRLDAGSRTRIVAARPLFPAGARGAEHGPLGIIEAFADLDTLRESLEAADSSATEGATRSSEDLEQVAQVLGFIDDVGRRLQLLALNGNIIAAQAGEHGRAFRVVCRELSQLGDRAKEALTGAARLAAALGLAEDLELTAASEAPAEELEAPPSAT